MSDHLLGSYLQALLAILLAQFSAKGFPGGMDGVVRLAEKSTPIKVYSSRPSLSLAVLFVSAARLACQNSSIREEEARRRPNLDLNVPALYAWPIALYSCRL